MHPQHGAPRALLTASTKLFVEVQEEKDCSLPPLAPYIFLTSIKPSSANSFFSTQFLSFPPLCRINQLRCAPSVL